jgi:hypothetical protein
MWSHVTNQRSLGDGNLKCYFICPSAFSMNGYKITSTSMTYTHTGTTYYKINKHILVGW